MIQGIVTNSLAQMHKVLDKLKEGGITLYNGNYSQDSKHVKIMTIMPEGKIDFSYGDSLQDWINKWNRKFEICTAEKFMDIPEIITCWKKPPTSISDYSTKELLSEIEKRDKQNIDPIEKDIKIRLQSWVL